MLNCAVTETHTRWDVLTVWHRRKDNNWDSVGRLCLFTLAKQIVVDSLTALPTILKRCNIVFTVLVPHCWQRYWRIYTVYLYFYIYLMFKLMHSRAHILWIRGALMCVSLYPLETGIKGAGLYGFRCWITKIQYGFFVLLKHHIPLGSLVACVAVEQSLSADYESFTKANSSKFPSRLRLTSNHTAAEKRNGYSSASTRRTSHTFDHLNPPECDA